MLNLIPAVNSIHTFLERPVPTIQTCHRPLPRVAYIRPHRVSQNGRTEPTLKREKTSFCRTYKEPLCRLRHRSASGQTTRSMSRGIHLDNKHTRNIYRNLFYTRKTYIVRAPPRVIPSSFAAKPM